MTSPVSVRRRKLSYIFKYDQSNNGGFPFIEVNFHLVLAYINDRGL